jgi:hypothetical protein
MSNKIYSLHTNGKSQHSSQKEGVSINPVKSNDQY